MPIVERLFTEMDFLGLAKPSADPSLVAPSLLSSYYGIKESVDELQELVGDPWGPEQEEALRMEYLLHMAYRHFGNGLMAAMFVSPEEDSEADLESLVS